MTLPIYRGRFAPSPTGPLHFGSLVAALASCLEAGANDGEWRLRIEDVDAPRCCRAAADEMLRVLEVFGFSWHGPVVWQSLRIDAYRQALDELIAGDYVFPCACSRRELADSRTHGLAVDGAAIYPGTCRHTLPPGKAARAWRLRVDSAPVEFKDGLQGCLGSDLTRDVGDFVLQRADGLFAYQLAVVVDDAAAGITHVVRGADLLDSTARQIYLQHRLAVATPAYVHLPVAVNGAGEKLSKQTCAPALDVRYPARELVAALDFLGQAPEPGLAAEPAAVVWTWARQHWSLAKVPRVRTRPYNPVDG